MTPIEQALLNALETAREALYNVPMVGDVYDQQHSDTHMQAALVAQDAINQTRHL